MKIYLVRHPETVANRDGIIYGWMDYPYTEKGQTMYETIPGYFQDKCVDHIFSSPLGRAERLATAISDITKVPVKRDDRLKEMNFGLLEGVFFDKMDEDQKRILDHMFSDFENFQIPGGESGFDIRARGRSFFEELIQEETLLHLGRPDKLQERPKEKTVVVVAHAMLLQMAIISLLDLDIKKAWNFRLKPGMIIKLKARKDLTTIEEMLSFETLFKDRHL